MATKEAAFTNHVRNVETVKNWILNHSSLNGCVEDFRITSIDYGIDLVPNKNDMLTEPNDLGRSAILQYVCTPVIQ